MIKRVVILRAARTTWYRNLVGSTFDVEVNDKNRFSYVLVDNDFNFKKLFKPDHMKRLAQSSIGIAIEDCQFVDVSSNAAAKSFLSKEY